MERFPLIALMIARQEEKKLIDEPISKVSVEKAEVLYFYGLGTGAAYFEYKQWLEKNRDHQLVFLEDEPGCINAFLQLPQALEILKDPQVHLELIGKKGEEIDALTRRFPVKRLEVTALKSKGPFQKLRLKILRKTALTHALHLDRLHGYQPFHNFIQNLKQLPHSFYANQLKGAFKDTPAIVCGAGPSLQKSMDLLKTLENKALLIAGGSTLAALSSQGIMPHFGMAIDPNLEEYRRLRNSFAFEVPLLYSTRVHPGVFQTANGPFGYMRSGIGGISELWIEEELGLLDPLLGEELSSETISVTGICVAWAQFLGCNPIILDGIDMAYTGNKRYSSGVVEEKDLGLKAIDDEKSAADRIIRRKDRSGKLVSTAVRWVMESESISHFAKKHPQTLFLNATDGGIGFKGIDYVPLQDAIKSFKESQLRKKVFDEIQKASMPKNTAKLIEEKTLELKESLAKVIEHLLILADQKKGSKALAEMELKEESAFFYLFYDIYQVLKMDEFFWTHWLDLAKKYKAVLG